MTLVTAGCERAVGLLGGTFDPPHIGHLLAGVSVRHALGLDEVLLVPAGDPWQKSGTRQITPAAHRLDLTEAAVHQIPGLATSAIEVRRSGPSYTVDTVEALREERPGVGIVVVLGADAAAGLPTWHRFRDLLALVDLAVVGRMGVGDGVVPDLPAEVTDTGVVVHEVAMPGLEVSSTDLRRRVAGGEPIDVLVPPAVQRCIRMLGLYRPEASA